MTTLGYINRKQVIPSEYKPSKKIIVCGNEIYDYNFLISDGGFYPILIGDSEVPRIWLFSKNENGYVITVVEDNVSYLGQIRIDIDRSKKNIDIRDLKSKIDILKLDYSDVVTVHLLDLRPLGYNVFGDSTTLHAGNARLKNNTFRQVFTVIGFGG